MVRPFAAQLIKLAVHMPLVFVSGIWDDDCAPHIRLAFAVANEQSGQADGVQTVCLGTPARRFSSLLDESTITLLIP